MVFVVGGATRHTKVAIADGDGDVRPPSDMTQVSRTSKPLENMEDRQLWYCRHSRTGTEYTIERASTLVSRRLSLPIGHDNIKPYAPQKLTTPLPLTWHQRGVSRGTPSVLLLPWDENILEYE
jgi:hypothetical protein